MTYDDIIKIGTAKPDVIDTMTWGTPGLKRKKRFMLRLKEDGESIAVRLDWETHDRLLVSHPVVLFKTPHYDGYPAVLARLDMLTPALAQELIDASWEFAPIPDKKSK
jgi:hypothetical protein